ncbi:DNA-3-methyladenine glycosylase 2 family protein [Pseudorhizobium endolithicum]|uniref:DNA-3-methyladenine glycosylase II n=1 Tax=Pseudorhizobium endolithicum TaxID=1191678 RepID=A0ABN7JKL5_9HYPH|nr:DNA-3-methyladenine glycosylase [Pseudorhizobium endolithicum]CAD6432674.1 DNA-3-methyladenine glycosylase 2 family protein [Rhizobium sp. Q54]CAD7034677.1 DNA-3-methyladenine glycosylase 2 family protein [Pseudorhizobium endolithicum]
MRIIRDAEDVGAGLTMLAAADPRLVPVIAVAGPVPLRLMEPGFAGLAFIVVSQMISKASAAAIWNRICAAGPATAEGYLLHDPDRIATFGLSRAKAATLHNLARLVADGDVDLHGLAQAEPEAAMAQLTALPGIGPWTAEVYLMFCGGHADVFPAGDVALQAAAAAAFGLPERPSARELSEVAAAWRPWRSVAARLLWAYYSARLRKDVAPVVV